MSTYGSVVRRFIQQQLYTIRIYSSKLILQGLDAFDYLKVVGDIRGTLPPVGPMGTELSVEPYSEEFTRVRPGLIKATSERELMVRRLLLQLLLMSTK